MVDSVQTAFGLFFIVAGSLGFCRPYYLAKLGEQFDAIGSRTPVDEVEPAGWNVFLTKVVGGGMVLFGLLVLAIGLLAPSTGM